MKILNDIIEFARPHYNGKDEVIVTVNSVVWDLIARQADARIIYHENDYPFGNHYLVCGKLRIECVASQSEPMKFDLEYQEK